MRKVFGVQTLLWLALLLALVGSLRHVAWGFSTLENGDLVAGYVQAVAVDVGLFSLAVGISQRKRQGRGTFVLWIGVILFAGLSTYANILHGLVFLSDIGLSDWGWLDIARPFALSGVLPLLVVYLSEIVGSDVSFALNEAERVARREERKRQREDSTEAIGTFPMPIDQARDYRKLGREQAIDALLAFYVEHPGATHRQAGAVVTRSRSWVGTQLKELEAQGVIRRNGDGIEVVTP